MSKFNRFLDRGRQMVELTKVGVKIEKEEANIDKLYENLGRVFYKAHSKAPEVMYADIFRTIAGAEHQLEFLKKEASLISNRGRCQHCEQDMDPNALFCSKCGTAVETIIDYK